ncbi:condensation domain-containing protein, partial [Paraburkholderia jirisanensis]
MASPSMVFAAVHPSPDNGEIYDLSSAQQVVWIDQMAHPDAPLYNIGMALQIDGELDLVTLEQAVNQVVAANDALRLVMCDGDGLARQKRLPAVRIRIPLLDFSAEPDADARALAFVKDAFRRPFTKLGELLWDTQLVRVSATRYYWLHRYHHLVTDGIGVSLTGLAFADLYNRLQQDPTATLETGPSYLDLVADDQAYLASPRFARDREFWGKRFASLPPPLLERSGTLTLGAFAPSAQLRWSIARELFDSLAAFAAAHDSSIANLFLAVLGVYFSRTSHVDEVVIGLPVHNRGSARAKRTFGMFSSVSPVGLRVDQQATIVDLIGEVGAELRTCYRHQRFPIAQLNRDLKLAHAGRKQLFDVRLSFESLDGDHMYGSALSRVVALDNGAEQTPLSIFVRDYHPHEDVVVDFNFNTAALTFDEAAQIQQRVALLLATVLEMADVPVGLLPLIDQQERESLLVGLNDTAVDYPRDTFVHALFEQQVEATPEAVAAVFEAQQVSYRELNARANQLAHHLLSLGVQP